MSKVRIVTDSSCQIPDALRQQLEIHVVQLQYAWDGVSYLDEIDMGPREFYSRLRESDSIPTTSAPTTGSFIQVIEELSKEGDAILVIHVGSEFSHTYKTAEIAKENLPEAAISIIDSHSNGLGLGFQVLAAARAAQAGANLDDLLAVADQVRAATGAVFAVKNPEYIHRGGRISLGQRFLASSLNLIPIMEIDNGPVELKATVRGRKKSLAKLVEIVIDRARKESLIRVGVFHADNEPEAFELRKSVESRIQPNELLLEELSPVLGIHAGPGAVGLAYCLGI